MNLRNAVLVPQMPESERASLDCPEAALWEAVIDRAIADYASILGIGVPTWFVEAHPRRALWRQHVRWLEYFLFSPLATPCNARWICDHVSHDPDAMFEAIRRMCMRLRKDGQHAPLRLHKHKRYHA